MIVASCFQPPVHQSENLQWGARADRFYRFIIPWVLLFRLVAQACCCCCVTKQTALDTRASQSHNLTNLHCHFWGLMFTELKGCTVNASLIRARLLLLFWMYIWALPEATHRHCITWIQTYLTEAPLPAPTTLHAFAFPGPAVTHRPPPASKCCFGQQWGEVHQ